MRLQSATFFSSYDDYQSWSEDSSSSSGFFLIGAFGRQSVHGYMREKLQEQEYMAAIGGQAQTTYKATMRWSPIELRYFYGQGNFSGLPIAADQQFLPATRESDEDIAAYQAFINKYGTHYLDTAEFGGHLHLVYSMNSSFAKSTNITFSEKMSFFGLTLGFFSIGFGGGGAHAKASITSEAKDVSELAFVGYGGSQALLQSGLYSLWRDTIPASAAPINATYTAISELIVDDSKRANMEVAIAAYLNLTAALEPNAPFGLPPVQCGSSPGSANSSINAIPVNGSEPADVPGARERLEAARADGAAAVARRAQRGVKHEIVRPLRTIEIDTPVGPMRVRLSQRPPLAMGPTDLDMRAMDATPLAVTSDPVTGGLILPVSGPELGVGFGYDPVTGSLRAPIVSSSATLANSTWFDPSSNITWRIPDGWTFASTPFSCAEEVTRAYSNASFVASFNAKISMVGIGFGFDGLSIGAFFSSEREQASAELNSFQDGYFGVDRSISMYRLSAGHAMAAGTMLRGGFMEAVLALPVDTSDPSFGNAYDQFLSTYGTHYVHQASLGGSCSLGISYDQSALISYSEAYKKHQFGIMIGYMFDGIGINFDLSLTKSQFSQNVDQAFLDASTYHLDCVGGDPNKLASLDYLGWLLSIGFNPNIVPQSIRLRPLYDLVGFDAVRRSLLQQQSQAYFNRVGNSTA